MRVLRTVIAVVALVAILQQPCSADRYTPNTARANAESLFLEEIQTQVNEQARLSLLKQFLQRYPSDPSIGWVYEQMHGILTRSGQHQEALQIGEKLLAIDPDDLEAAFRNVQIAQASKDPVLVRKHAARSAESARRVLAKRQPADAADLARQIVKYSEYLEFVDVTQTADAKERLVRMDAFARNYPDSAYRENLESLYFSTYEAAGERAKAIDYAERLIQSKGSDNEDLLMAVAEKYFGRGGDEEKAVLYAARALEAMRHSSRPDSIAEADWTKKINRLSGRANWILGKIYMDRGQFGSSDKHLRAALPSFRGNDAMTAALLFHLGWVNYKLGNLTEAAKFNETCLSFKGSFQAQAARNLEVIRAERASTK